MGNSGSPIAQGAIAVCQPPDPLYINLADNLGINQTNSLIARLYPTMDGPGVSGTVQLRLDERSKQFRVVVKIRGVDPFTPHGLHLHTFGNDDPAAGHHALGGHYNPLFMPHDLPSPISNARHLGDLGVVNADAAGNIDADLSFDFSSAAFHLVHTLRGRGVLIHAVADSGEQPDGGTGDHLAQGVLGLSNQAMPPPPALYTSFCDRYAGIFGLNQTHFISSALQRALWGVNRKKTPNMRFPDVNGAAAIHEVPGCMGEESPIREWFNGGIGYRTRRSPPPLIPPAPDFTEEDSTAYPILVDHMTQYFALMLGCSGYTSSNYTGTQNMYVVHRDMLLGQEAFSYFGQQLRVAFTSFGCLPDDVSLALNPILVRFLRGSSLNSQSAKSSSSSSNGICSESNCQCAPNLCGADCSPQACQPPKINGSLPKYPRGYIYDTPISDAKRTAAATGGVLLIALSSLLAVFAVALAA